MNERADYRWGLTRRQAVRRPGRSPARFLLYGGVMASSWLSWRAPGIPITVGDLIIFLAAIMSIAQKPIVRLRIPRYSVAAAVLCAGGGLASTLVSSDPLGSLLMLARLLFLLVGFPWLFSRLLTSDRYVRRVGEFWLLGAATSALVAVVQAAWLPNFLNSQVWAGGRLTGLSANVSDLAGVATAAVGFGIGLIVTRGGGSERWIALALSAVCFIGLVLSGSVSGVLAIVITIMTAFMLNMPKPGRIATVFFPLALLTIVAERLSFGVGGAGIIDRLRVTTGETAGVSDDSATAITRLESIVTALSKIAANPFLGRGLAPSEQAVRGSISAHNVVLAAWVAGGVLVAAGVLLALLSPIRAGIRSRNANPNVRCWLYASVSAVTFSMTAPSLIPRYLWIPLAVLAVVARRRLAEAPTDTGCVGAKLGVVRSR